MPEQGQHLYEHVALQLTEELICAFGDEIDSVILYGSVARKEGTAQSDIDVMVVGPNIHQHMAEISMVRTQIDLQYNTVTTLFYITPQEIYDWINKGDPFLPEVMRDGVVLHGREQIDRIYPETV